jgi:2,4-dienoyl-CoA reductase-like NADH-dependent reductase (Old Yellow Enzyme family)
VRDEVGDEALVTCRLGVEDKDSGGFTLEEGRDTASMLVGEGAKILDISHGIDRPQRPEAEGSPYSSLLHLSRSVKDEVNVPVIGVGGVLHPEQAEKALADDMADLIAVGKGLLADPGWARKTIAGEAESIAVCRQCERCFHFTDPSKCPARKQSDG